MSDATILNSAFIQEQHAIEPEIILQDRTMRRQEQHARLHSQLKALLEAFVENMPLQNREQQARLCTQLEDLESYISSLCRRYPVQPASGATPTAESEQTLEQELVWIEKRIEGIAGTLCEPCIEKHRRRD